MNDVEKRLRAAAEAMDRDRLWAALSPLEPLARTDLRVARMWAEALRTSPGRPTLEEEAEAILEAWPAEVGVVAPACDALIRRAGRRALDEPPASRAGAIAAEAAGRALGRLSDEQRRDPELGGALLALLGNALRTLGPKRLDDAAAALERAIALEPRASWLFDLGLAHKHARNWERMLEANRRARALLGDTRREVLFNLAVAATATGEGELAADTWRAVGVPAEHTAGSLPFVPGLPAAQLRLPTVGSDLDFDAQVPVEAAGFEVVWVQPLSPCHGVVRSPTHREALADFGDLVLWDPAPVSVVEREGEPVPRFALLAVLRAGDERRLRFLALQQRRGQVDAIGTALPDDVVLYSHGERVEVVCPRCAAGDLHVKHEHLPAEAHRIAYGKLIVPASRDLAEFAQALEAATREQPGVLLAVPDLYERLGETAQAGKHHKRWGAIARTRA